MHLLCAMMTGTISIPTGQMTCRAALWDAHFCWPPPVQCRCPSVLLLWPCSEQAVTAYASAYIAVPEHRAAMPALRCPRCQEVHQTVKHNMIVTACILTNDQIDLPAGSAEQHCLPTVGDWPGIRVRVKQRRASSRNPGTVGRSGPAVQARRLRPLLTSSDEELTLLPAGSRSTAGCRLSPPVDC
jgi:hypothetical protein